MWVQAAPGYSLDWLEETIEHQSDHLNRTRKISRFYYYLQWLSHQTRHRSQITAALQKIGIDYGSTALLDNPDDEF